MSHQTRVIIFTFLGNQNQSLVTTCRVHGWVL